MLQPSLQRLYDFIHMVGYAEPAAAACCGYLKPPLSLAIAEGHLCLRQDLVLDCPNAAHQLTLFLARAVADGVLPASFLQSVLPSLSDTSLGVSVVQSAGKPGNRYPAWADIRACPSNDMLMSGHEATVLQGLLKGSLSASTFLD